MKQDETKTKKRGIGPIRRAVRAFIGFKWAYLLFAIIFVAAGLGFIAHPEEASGWVCIAVGIIAVVFSIFTMVVALSGKKRGFPFWAKMVTTSLGIVTGIVVIVMTAIEMRAPEEEAVEGITVFGILACILGLYLIVDGAFKLQTSILSRRYKSWLWWVMLVLVIVSMGVGVYLLRVDPSNNDIETTRLLARLVGTGFLIDGVLNFLSIIFLYKIEHGQRDEVIRELEEEGRLAVIEDAPTADAATLEENTTDETNRIE